MTTLFDLLNDINYNKKNILNEENKKEYKPFIINRFLSGSIDTVMYAQEMNQRAMLDPEMQYAYLLRSIRPRKRFVKWLKPEKLEDLDTVREYYGMSARKAKEVLDMIPEDELAKMRERLSKGGLKSKNS